MWRQALEHRLAGRARILLLALAALFLLSAAPARADSCVHHFTYEGQKLYIRYPSSKHVVGRRTVYSDSSCQTKAAGHCCTIIGGGGYALASSRDAAWNICKANNRYTVTDVGGPSGASGREYACNISGELAGSGNSPSKRSVRLGYGKGSNATEALAVCRSRYPATAYVAPHSNVDPFSGQTNVVANTWRCLATWGSSSGSSWGGGGRGQVPKLPLTGLELNAVDGMNSGIQFSRLSNYGIGDPRVFEMGFLDAVDVWSNIGNGYSVCFPQVGRIVFLDAATSPRSLLNIEYTVHNLKTCAELDRAGTVVLVEHVDSQTAPASTGARRPGTDDSIADARNTPDCDVTTRVYLRLRDAPWGRILAIIPPGRELRAQARTNSWFKVAYAGRTGWSAAWLVDSAGSCG